MRPATAVRVVVVIAAAWALALLVQTGRGATITRASSGGLLALIVVVGGIGFLVQRFRIAPRRGSFADQVATLGLHAEAGDPLRLLREPFAVFHLAGSARDIENTATGTLGGRSIVVADYWFAPSSNPSLDDVRRYVCVVDPHRPGWPDLAVLPPSIGTIVQEAVGLRGVELESEAFNRAFTVRCDDRRFAYALLDARMIAWLLDEDPDTGIEVRAGRLMVYGRRPTTSLDDVDRAVRRFDGFVRHIPGVIASLFPVVGTGPDAAASGPSRPDR